MIERFYTTSFTVKRMVWAGGKSSLSEVATFDGHIQQGTDERFQEYKGLTFTKAFTIWAPTSVNVVEGDIVNDGTNDYSVRLFQNREIGANSHNEIIVEKTDG